jgi:M6 family metalloprotease-like protein
MKKHQLCSLAGLAIALVIFLMAATNSVQAAPLVGVPVRVTQPDGTILDCFASGDEYYNWLHDAEGYTIIQDHTNGYYVYANLVGGKLVPTAYVPGKIDPGSVGLLPNLNISPEKIEAIRSAYPSPAPGEGGPFGSAPTSGVVTNLVVFIRFSGESEFTTATSTYNNMLNSTTPGANSLRNYFTEVSYNASTVSSNLYPTPGTTIISYQDSHPRGYFQPYDATTNPIGYDTDRTTREHTLLRDAINYVNGLGQFPSGSIIDADSDGYVDSVTFVIYGSPTGWNSLLWPHAWALYSYNVTINTKRVYSYSLQLQSMVGTGVLAHETFHVMGSPDLYHYYTSGSPVGRWDVMDSNANPPEHMGCYMKYKYGEWISSIAEITTPHAYSLNPLTSPTGNCYKIDSPNSTTEFFILEYRLKGTSTFEASLPGIGLLVYRINSGYRGNAYGPPDEVYAYRPGGTPTANGTVNLANFSSDVGRTEINDTTDPYSFLTDGSAGGLDICSIGSSGSTISFFYGSCEWEAPPSSFSKTSPDDAAFDQSGNLTLDWADPGDATYFEYCIDPSLGGGCNTGWIDAGSTSQATVNGLAWNKTYEWQVRAINSRGTTSANTDTWWQFTTQSITFTDFFHMPLGFMP